MLDGLLSLGLILDGLLSLRLMLDGLLSLGLMLDVWKNRRSLRLMLDVCKNRSSLALHDLLTDIIGNEVIHLAKSMLQLPDFHLLHLRLLALSLAPLDGLGNLRFREHVLGFHNVTSIAEKGFVLSL